MRKKEKSKQKGTLNQTPINILWEESEGVTAPTICYCVVVNLRKQSI